MAAREPEREPELEWEPEREPERKRELGREPELELGLERERERELGLELEPEPRYMTDVKALERKVFGNRMECSAVIQHTHSYAIYFDLLLNFQV